MVLPTEIDNIGGTGLVVRVTVSSVSDMFRSIKEEAFTRQWGIRI